MIYPEKLNSRKGEIILNTLLITSITLAIVMIIINRIVTPQIHWSAIANCGMIYVWITVLYSIKKGTNIAGHVLLQTIIISIAMLYIDEHTGFKAWSLNIGIPIVIIVANITMLILTIISYKHYISYAICQLMIVLISLLPIIFIWKNMLQIEVLSYIAIWISVLSLVISLMLAYKDVKEAIIRKIHL